MGQNIFLHIKKAIPQGRIDFPMFDLTTEEGLRKTLNSIQDLNPVLPKNELSQYEARNFENWAKNQGISNVMYEIVLNSSFSLHGLRGFQAREWHLLPLVGHLDRVILWRSFSTRC